MSSNDKYDIRNAYSNREISLIVDKLIPILKIDYNNNVVKETDVYVQLNGYVRILNISKNESCVLYFNNHLENYTIDKFILSILIKDALIYKYFSNFDLGYLDDIFGATFAETLKHEYDLIAEYL